MAFRLSYSAWAAGMNIGRVFHVAGAIAAPCYLGSWIRSGTVSWSWVDCLIIRSAFVWADVVVVLG